MKFVAATVALGACLFPLSAFGLAGGTEALTSKPGVTAEEISKLSPARRDELIARTVRQGSFASRGICAPGHASLVRGPAGATYWRMDCADDETHVVVMPSVRQGQAIVVSCRRAKTALGVDCGAPKGRRANR